MRGLLGSRSPRRFRFLFFLYIKRRPHIPLTFGKQTKRVSVAVDAGSIPEAVLLRNRAGTSPVDEIALNLIFQKVRADLTFRRVATHTFDGFLHRSCL